MSGKRPVLKASLKGKRPAAAQSVASVAHIVSLAAIPADETHDHDHDPFSRAAHQIISLRKSVAIKEGVEGRGRSFSLFPFDDDGTAAVASAAGSGISPAKRKKLEAAGPHEFLLHNPHRMDKNPPKHGHHPTLAESIASHLARVQPSDDQLADTSSDDDEEGADGEQPESAQSEKEVKRVLWRMNLLGRWQNQYADWEWRYLNTKIVDHNFFITLSIILLPILSVFTLWDFLAATYFEIPHLTWIQHYGVLMPIHCLCLPFAMYGYIMRQIYYRSSGLTTMALLGIILHPILFTLHCATDIIFSNCRAEGGLHYELYPSGPDERPSDYDPDFDYEKLKARTSYEFDVIES